MTYTVVNQSPEPIMLEDGTVLGAANTKEARKVVTALSDLDRKRYCARGRIRVDLPEGERCDTKTKIPVAQSAASGNRTPDKGGK